MPSRTITGNFSDPIGTVFSEQIGGATAGAGYDQIEANGSVTLGGTLSLSLTGGFQPTFGQVYTIINNDGTDLVAGVFDGSPLVGGAATIVQAGGRSFALNYHGGDGNDVTLTPEIAVTGITATPSSSGPLGAGKAIAFTLTTEASVDVSGSPTLTLSNGDTATYDAAKSSFTNLVFDYTTVAGKDTPDLQVTGLNLNGGAITHPAGTLKLTSAGTINVGEPFDATAVADVNGDGKADLIVTSPGAPGLVTVFDGNGDGTFAAVPTSYLTGGSASPVSVAVTDLNGDGRPDIVTTNFNSNNVSVLLNNGDGTFAAQTSYATGLDPVSVVVADLNGDGKADLLVGSHFSPEFDVLLGNGDGTFQASNATPTPASVVGVATYDFDHDGSLDIAVAMASPDNRILAYSFVNGGYHASGGVNVRATIAAVAIGAVGGADTFSANADGTVSDVNAGLSYAAGNVGNSIGLADMNGDGRVDIVVAGSSGVQVLLAKADGMFAAPVTFPVSGSGFKYATVADVNGDGKADVILGNGTSETVLLNTTSSPAGVLDLLTVGTATGHDTGIVVDTTAPGAPTVALANDTGVSSTDKITNDGTLAVTPAEAGGTITYSTTGTTFSPTPPTFTGDGVKFVDVKQTDAAGNVGPETTFSFTLDTTAPTLGSLSTVAGDDVINAAEKTGPITISGTTSAEDGQIVTIALTKGGGPALVSATAPVSGGAYSVTFPAGSVASLTDGTYVVTANVADKAGNPAVQQSHLIGVDATPPTITLNTLEGDDVINATEKAGPIFVSGTATGAEDGQLVTIALKNASGATTFASATAPVSNGAYSLTLPAGTATVLPDGTYTVTADAQDVAGNAAIEASRTLKVDTTAPTLTIDPIAGDNVINAAEAAGPIVISGKASGAEDGRVVSIDLGNGSAPLSATVSGGAYSVTLPAGSAASLPDGTYMVTANVSDVAGNKAAPAGVSLTVAKTTADTTADGGSPATLTVDATANGIIDNFESHAVAFTVTGLDTDAHAVATFTDGTHTATAAIAADGVFTIDLSGSGLNGTVASSLAIMDDVGNTASVAGSTFKIDLAADEALFGTVVHDVSGVAGQLVELYEGLLGRAPDASGAEYWETQFAHGATISDVAARLLASPEYTTAHGPVSALNDAGFVSQIYQVELGHDPDPKGDTFWLDALAHGTTRADVAVGIATSLENLKQDGGLLAAGVFVPDPIETDVARLYYGVLGHAPDAAGLQYWTNAVRGGASEIDVAANFLASSDYTNTHGTATSDADFLASLYAGALGRAPDAGAGFWQAALASGQSRAAVAQAISESPEAIQHHVPEIEAGWHIG